MIVVMNPVNAITIDREADGPNFALLAKRDGRYVVWDRVWSSSRTVAESYFRSRYPREIRKVVPC